MQHKGAIRALAIIFGLIFLYQLSFTLVTKRVEKKAVKYAEAEASKLANGDESELNALKETKETYYLDSVSNTNVYNLLFKKFTYRDAKEREINLGLDLKGGMNVTLEVSVKDIVNALSGHSQDPVFLQAMEEASRGLENSEGDFVTLFGEAYEKADPNAKLASIFLYEFKDKGITVNSSNDEVLKVLKEESDGAIDRSYQILRTRIDRFGVAQPNIQKMESSGRILVELPGIKDPKRVRKLLQGTAQLEFWETYNFNELAQYFDAANAKLAENNKAKNELDTEAAEEEVVETAEETPVTEGEEVAVEEEATETEVAEADTTADADLLEQMNEESEEELSEEEQINQFAENNPLFAYLQPSYYQNEAGQVVAGATARIGIAQVKDTAVINQMLAETKSIFPRTLKFAWTVKPEITQGDAEFLELVALKMSRDNKAALGGEVITDARQDYGQNNQVEVTIQMNSEGAKTWKRLTGENIGRQIAIVLDDYVYSYPNVNDEIPNGRSSISGGGMTIEEAQDLANILKAGKLPAPARILEEQVVGPSLGKEAVQKGMWSMVFAFILVLVYMVFFYNKSGLVADIALLVNVFFLFGVLACLGSVLTLPGIAGIVLTLGMAVDSNVIIFERIKEEVRNGKGLKLAIDEGYKNAYSAIIDGNVTTLITGVILIILGTGPVHSFAVTLCVGILTSLFTSIFISRLIFARMLEKEKDITFSTNATRNFLQNTSFDFIDFRKTAFIIAGIFVVISVGSLAIRGMNLGIDFTGGRNYVVQFDNSNMKVEDVRQALTDVNIDKAAIHSALEMRDDQEVEDWSTPEVKTYGTNGQVKITTKFLIKNDNPAVDSIIQVIMYDNLKGLYNQDLNMSQFSSEDETVGILSTQKVGATIASDVTRKSIIAIIVALALMFCYIVVRFRKWQYGLASIMALAHDTILVLGMYSLFYNVLPFTMEVDQSFIAAVLTVIGYSINATVVIFDRIRENVNNHPKATWKENMVNAVNSTLTRSFNTSGSTLVVLLAIFIFGGDTIRGFIFALLVGIIAGTFSSVFLSTPFAYVLMKGKAKDEAIEENAKSLKK
ncbi:MAG: protein translocase subunit SecDF [Bacteroidales bacterium]|nr:protein translocase subunit SecDF [Bacteroidales bacterium]